MEMENRFSLAVYIIYILHVCMETVFMYALCIFPDARICIASDHRSIL